MPYARQKSEICVVSQDDVKNVDTIIPLIQNDKSPEQICSFLMLTK